LGEVKPCRLGQNAGPLCVENCNEADFFGTHLDVSGLSIHVFHSSTANLPSTPACSKRE
jgi:hypothetical protein